MMNRHFLHPATLFFLLTLVVALLSWVGSIYGWSGVQSLLSAEGLRWQLRNVGDGFFSAPFLAISCCWLSGWDSVCIQVLGGCPTSNLSWQKTFPKRKAFVVVESDRWGSLYTGSFVSGFRSMGIVRSITGGLKNSPLSEGVSYLLSLGLGIMAIIYGYSIDLYRTDRDIIRVCRIALSVFLAIVLHCFL